MKWMVNLIAVIVPFIGRCPFWMQILAVVWVAFTGIVAVLALVCALTLPALPGVSLAIIKPEPGSIVTVGGNVEFTSPQRELQHYVLVVPQQSPTRWIVDGPILVTSDAPHFGHARFGDSSAGAGEQFSLQILSTRQQLSLGPIDQLPPDSILSPPILVQRAR